MRVETVSLQYNFEKNTDVGTTVESCNPNLRLIEFESMSKKQNKSFHCVLQYLQCLGFICMSYSL